VTVIYFGSTKFSLPIVKTIKENFDLLGVVVIKPKPGGRGLKIVQSEVAQWAQDVGVQFFSPDNPNEDNFIENLSKLKPDIFVLSAYGHILGPHLLEIPRLGSVNIHPSLLPKYRGAAPIQRVLMAGEKKTGITVFFMDEKIDHGSIIFQKDLTIEPYENHGSLADRLSMLGAEIVVDVLKSIDAGTYKKISQDERDKTYAPKITKEEMYINWQLGIEKVFNLIRALFPKPGARTLFRNKELIIFHALPGDKKLAPGLIAIANKNVYVGTGDGSVILKELKLEGGSMITGLDFINGYRIKEGEKLQ